MMRYKLRKEMKIDENNVSGISKRCQRRIIITKKNAIPNSKNIGKYKNLIQKKKYLLQGKLQSFSKI